MLIATIALAFLHLLSAPWQLLGWRCRAFHRRRRRRQLQGPFVSFKTSHALASRVLVFVERELLPPLVLPICGPVAIATAGVAANAKLILLIVTFAPRCFLRFFNPLFLSRGPPLLFFRHLPCFYYTVLTAMLANDLARIASRTRVCKGRWRAGWRQWIRRRWAVAVRHSSDAARHGMVRDGKESGASEIGAGEGEMATKWRKDEDNGCRSDFGSGGDSGGGDDLWKCCGELSCLLSFLVSFVETERISTKSDSDRMDSVGPPNRSVRKVSTGPQLALR